MRNTDKFTLDELFFGFKAVVKADQEMKLGVPGGTSLDRSNHQANLKKEQKNRPPTSGRALFFLR